MRVERRQTLGAERPTRVELRFALMVRSQESCALTRSVVAITPRSSTGTAETCRYSEPRSKDYRRLRQRFVPAAIMRTARSGLSSDVRNTAHRSRERRRRPGQSCCSARVIQSPWSSDASRPSQRHLPASQEMEVRRRPVGDLQLLGDRPDPGLLRSRQSGLAGKMVVGFRAVCSRRWVILTCRVDFLRVRVPALPLDPIAPHTRHLPEIGAPFRCR
jgi:hypothetical protein